ASPRTARSHRRQRANHRHRSRTALHASARDRSCFNRRKEQQVGTTVIKNLRTLAQFFQKAGPYLLMEILLPGGTLIALVVFLYRRGGLRMGMGYVLGVNTVVERALAQVREVVLLAQPSDIAALVRSDPGGESDGLEPLAMAPAR